MTELMLFLTTPSLTLKGGSSVYGTKPLTRARAGIPYREQSPKTKENDVIMILSSLAYITLIRLLFCMSAGKRERERILVKKKKSKSVGNDFTVKQMIKKQDKRDIINFLIRNGVRFCSPIIDAVVTFGHIFASRW